MSATNPTSPVCGIVRKSFDEYLGDALPAPQRKMFREHLAGCAECRGAAVASDPTFRFARPLSDAVSEGESRDILAAVRTGVELLQAQRRLGTGSRRLRTLLRGSRGRGRGASAVVGMGRAAVAARAGERRHRGGSGDGSFAGPESGSRLRLGIAARGLLRGDALPRRRRCTTGTPAPAGRNPEWSGSWIGGWTFKQHPLSRHQSGSSGGDRRSPNPRAGSRTGRGFFNSNEKTSLRSGRDRVARRVLRGRATARRPCASTSSSTSASKKRPC